MAFSAAHAKILAAMLDPEQDAAFRFICGKGKDSKASQETIESLVALGLIRWEYVSDTKSYALLTGRGKKVAAMID